MYDDAIGVPVSVCSSLITLITRKLRRVALLIGQAEKNNMIPVAKLRMMKEAPQSTRSWTSEGVELAHRACNPL